MLNELLHKYLYKQPSKDDARSIKRWIDTASEPEIEQALLQEWEKHTVSEPRNWQAYYAVTGQLRSIFNSHRIKKTDQHSLINHVIKIAAILLIPLLLATGIYYVTKQYQYKIYASTQYRMETGKGERATLVLPDGTKVSLNSESSFTYPASFGKTDRNVHLQGEAYFEVAHDEELPFIVQAKQTYVKVLGTTFNIHTLPDDDWVETALVNGKVEFYEIDNPDNRITLFPDQTARFNTITHQFERNTIEQRLATAWKRGEIIFRSASWPEIIERISHYYGIEIDQETTKVPEERFTGSFLHEDVNNVLRNLQVHYHFTYTKTGNHIKITFKK